MIFRTIKIYNFFLNSYIDKNILINLFYFLIFAIIWVSLLGFGSPILIASGIFIWSMAWNSNFSYINIYWCISFIFNRNFFFKELVKKILEKKFEMYIQLFQKMNFIIFLFIGLLEGLEFHFFYKTYFQFCLE